VIDPGAIPQIGGDLDAVAAGGAKLRSQASAVSDTGSDVYTTWQQLSSVYDAPEAGELLQATAPVRVESAEVASGLETVGAALVAYADEVRPIKSQLEQLRSSASEFVGSVSGDDDWREDGGKVDEHNALMSGVSSAVAAWMEAQRRCANSINAVHGGTQYVADDGDGVLEANEFGYTADTLNAATASEQGVPWGRPEEEDLPWWEDLGNGVVSFGKGVVVDGIWGALQGLENLVNPWSDDFGASWAGLGKFALAATVVPTVINHFTALPGLDKGELGQTLTDAGKGIVAWDMWAEDPARAAGATLTNIVTAVIGTKGAGATLKGGTVAGRAGITALPRLADVRTAVASQIARIPRIDLPGLQPSWATGGAGSRFRFDVETPNNGRVHSESSGSTGGSSAPAPARTVPPLGSTDGGPGAWEGRARGGGSSASFDYQMQIAEVAAYADGKLPEYVVNGVAFDGFRDGVLLEAKGPRYAYLISRPFGTKITDDFVDDALRQIEAANGTPIRWSFAEEGAAAAVRRRFINEGLGDLIDVVWTPPTR